MMGNWYRRQRQARIFWSLIIGIWILVILGGCEQVSKPEIRKPGPLQVIVPAGTPLPEYHTPPARWRVQHSKAINLKDFSERECLLCHNPQTGCQRCHKYVAAREINFAEVAILWPSREKDDKETR